MLNSPCNPTGAVYEEDLIHNIAGLAKDRGIWVLSDESYEYLIYEGKHYSPACDFDNVVTVNAFSKSYAMTGWRLGYVTAPAELVEGMIKIYAHATTCVTSFAQDGAIEALHGASSREAVRRMVEGYAEQRALMLEGISRSDFLVCDPVPRGTFYCFPTYQADEPSIELATSLLKEAHVAAVPGAAFGQSGEGHLRLSYSTSKENIREALRRMEAFLAK